MSAFMVMARVMTPNVPSSATWPPKSKDCNRDAMARFAEAPCQAAWLETAISWAKVSGAAGETTTVREGKRNTTVRRRSVANAW